LIFLLCVAWHVVGQAKFERVASAPAEAGWHNCAMNPKKYLALKIDVDTLKGTKLGVPGLVDTLKKFQAGATFLFSLGPDHTGRAIKRVFRKGFLGKVKRTSVVQHYGFPTLLYGTVLPGPDIGRRCADILRRTRDDGFECGIHTWDHVKWQDGVANASAEWTRREMESAQNRFCDIFKEAAKTHGAAGWQMSKHALRLTEEMNFDYCSDGRGTEPHFPVVNGEIIDCPQLPTTLPTLDEMIGIGNTTESNVAQQLLKLTENCPPHGHVFTMHAELEGMRLKPVLEELITGWKAQGYELVPTRTILDSLQRNGLPYFAAIQGEVPGRSGTLLMQGNAFLPIVDVAA
jgi:peptidoglycan/xylan/chitin deacetylase (PgdA/CDA1 family)